MKLQLKTKLTLAVATGLLALGAMTTALGIAGVSWASSSVMFGSSWNARRQARLHAKHKAAQATS